MFGKSTILAALMTASLITVPAGASPVDQLVTGFYSPQLTAEEENAVSEGASPREHTQIWAPLTASGDVIVAAYSNQAFGQVRVLRVADGQGRLVWEVGELLDGEDPEIQTIDMNGDGHLDFMVTFTTGQGRSLVSSLFLFDGHSVTPVSVGSNYSPSFVDIDGDRVMELVDGSVHLNGDPWSSLFRLTPDGYEIAEPVVFIGTNGRGEKAQPTPQTEHFLSTVPSATLLIINGVGGFPRLSAVEVFLNGERVVFKNQFNETVARVETTVTLLTNDAPNTITSTVFGKPDSAIDLIIYVPGAKATRSASR